VKKVLVYSFLILFLSACKKETADKVDFGYEYFPLEIGSWVSYNVREIAHDIDLSPAHDTLDYQLKEIIESVFTDDEGRESYRIERYQRANENNPWVIKDVWTSIRTNRRAEKSEENLRIIKMVFPLKKGESWDGNVYNIQNKDDYEVLEVDEQLVFNGFNFDKTLTIDHGEFFSLVNLDKAYEVYAEGVGLISKTFIDLRINNFDVTDIERGVEYYQNIIDYGK